MFSIENQNSKTYLVYELGENDAIDNLTLGMMNNNFINGFLRMSYSQIDERKYFKYDITSKIPAAQIFSLPVNKSWVIGVFKSIVNALLLSEEYMINKNSFILNIDNIFVDISRNEAFVICLPLLNRDNVDVGEFFKRIMFSSKFNQSENCSYVANIINYLNSMVSFNARDFLTMLNAIDNPKPTNTSSSAQVVQNNIKAAHMPDEREGVTVSPQQVPPVSAKPLNRQNVQPMTANVQNTQPAVVSSAYNTAQPKPNVPIADKAVVNGNNKNEKSKQKTKLQTNTGFAVPGVMDTKSVNEVNMKNSSSNQQASQKKMSMFYLMCHYNKENVAAYKAQKEAKSAEKSQKVIPGNEGQQVNVSPTDININVPKQDEFINQPAKNTVPQQNTFVQQPQPVNWTQQNNIPVTHQNNVFSNFGETTVLGGENDGETTVLSELGDNPAAQSAKQPFLIRISNNEKISVNKPVYRIGKEKSYVDYFIGDNSYVSRGHANIISRNGKYYIIDNNSRNHTFVNGEIITSSTEVELKNGDTFKLANEAFEFKLF